MLTPFGIYVYNVLAMGLSNATDFCETCIHEVLQGLNGCTNIIENVLVYGKTYDEFKNNVLAFLDHCVQEDMHLNPDKVKIDCHEVPFFGYVLSKDGLNHFTLDVIYQPGAKMHLSDAISHLSTHDNSKGTTIQNLDVSIHAIEKLTGFNSLSVDKICQQATKDQTMQLLTQHINEGFPESSTKPPDSIKAYFSFRDKLSECNGIILKGHNRIVVPESLRPQAINILHNKAHLGLNKTLEWARTCMY